MSKRSIFTVMFCVSMLISQNGYSMFNGLSQISSIPEEPDERARIDIFDAIKEGNLKKVQYVVRTGIDLEKPNKPGKRGETPVMIAASHGHLKIVDYLIGKGANINVQMNGSTPLDNALKNCNVEVVQYLVDKDACMSNGMVFKGKDGTTKPNSVFVALDTVLPRFDCCQDESKLMNIVDFILTEAAEVTIDNKFLKYFIKQANCLEVKELLLSDYCRRNRGALEEGDFFVTEEVEKMTSQLNNKIKKKQKERDVLIEEIGKKKQGSKGYVFRSSLYYEIFGDIAEELNEMDQKKELLKEEIKEIAKKKRKLKKRFKISEYESDSAQENEGEESEDFLPWSRLESSCERDQDRRGQSKKSRKRLIF